MNLEDLEKLVENPQESLTLELKAWIDPATDEGREKIIKACIAMRNNNGGYILIGFDDTTRQSQPYPTSYEKPLQEKFHKDKIQPLVSKYSSEQFEIKVHYPKNKKTVVIEIPTGVKTPVAAKAGLEHTSLEGKHKVLVKKGTVYVRSLNANNTPSTAEATWEDWENLTDKCFDNREADIGRFMQRHLTKQNMKELGLLLAQTPNIQENSESEKKEMEEFFQDCESRYDVEMRDRLKEGKEISPHLEAFGLRQTGVIIKGKGKQYKVNDSFLNLIDSANPRYTGWPAWLCCRNASNKKSKPCVKDDAWESLILPNIVNHLTFWRIYPSGKFFLSNALQDDISGSGNAPPPLSALDFALTILRAGEEILVALSFAKAMGYDPEQTVVKFGFKWTQLEGRELCSWANPTRHIYPRKAEQNNFYQEIEIPLNASNSLICRSLYEIISPLFNLFEGFEIEYPVVDDLFGKLINRKL